MGCHRRLISDVARSTLLIGSLLLLSGSSCNGLRNGVDFGTNLSILRGNWVQGEPLGLPLLRLLDLEATQIDSRSYAFTGHMQLLTKGELIETAIEGTGDLLTHDFSAAREVSRLIPAPSPPRFAMVAEGRDETGEIRWRLEAETEPYHYPPQRYRGAVTDLTDGTTAAFALRLLARDEPDVQAFVADPVRVQVNSATMFTWSAFLATDDSLRCTLMTGEGPESFLIDDCVAINHHAYDYRSDGVFTATFRVVNSRTGHFTEASSQVQVTGVGDGTLQWYVPINAGVSAPPAIAADGTLFVSSNDGHLHRISGDGTLAWTRQAGPPSLGMDAAPAMGEDGTIYVASLDRHLYAFSPDGALKWRFAADGPISSSPAIAADGTVIVGSLDRHLYAVSPAGTLTWRFLTENDSGVTLNSAIESSPAIAPDGTIYVGTEGGHLFAIRSDGAAMWDRKVGSDVYSSPAVGADGTVYVGSRRSNSSSLFAVDPDGTMRWRYDINGWVTSSPAIGPAGVIYVGSDYTRVLGATPGLYAINQDGTLSWFFQTQSDVRASPAVGLDGTIYVDGYALEHEGTLRWRSSASGSPAIGTNGTVYFGGSDGLYAYNAASQGLADTAWPKFRGDAGNTGRRQ